MQKACCLCRAKGCIGRQQQAHGADYFMPATIESFQHVQGMGRVFRLAKDVAVHSNYGIRGQYHGLQMLAGRALLAKGMA